MDRDNPPTTIINVKAVPAEAWEAAKRAANRRGQTMGEWLGNACTQQANREAGDGIIQPTEPYRTVHNPPALAVDLREVAAVISAMAAANLPVQKRVAREVNALLYRQLISALPPPGAQTPHAMLETDRAPGLLKQHQTP